MLDALNVPTDNVFQTTIELNGWITPNANPCVSDIKCNLCGDKGMIAIDASNHNLIQYYSDDKMTVPDVLVRNRVHGYVKRFAYESILSFVDRLAIG